MAAVSDAKSEDRKEHEPEFCVRERGTDRVEVGARLWGFTVPRVLTTYGAAVDTKIGVIRPDKGKGKFQAATGLSLAYHQARYGGQPNHVFGLTVPVLLLFVTAQRFIVRSISTTGLKG